MRKITLGCAIRKACFHEVPPQKYPYVIVRQREGAQIIYHANEEPDGWNGTVLRKGYILPSLPAPAIEAMPA
jgi:hypothetical protein